MEKMKIEMSDLKGDGLEKAIEKVVEAKWPAIGGGRSRTSENGLTLSEGRGGGKGWGKASGKDAKRIEERERTITFANFPKETQEDDIIKMINEKVADISKDIEEVYAYAKTGTRGAAKFCTEDAMWNYVGGMGGMEGQLTHEYNGNTVYVNAGATQKNDADAAREKAVRKVVRTLIEAKGGDGAAIKKRIDSKYKIGIVWWKGDDSKWLKVAEWSVETCKMELKNGGEAYQSRFNALME